jgi:NADP-reducing hydrogenase subunit HndD
MHCPQFTQATSLKDFSKAIYEEDEASVLRRSHENPTIQKLYAEFLGQPCGEKSHHLLHTHYVKRDLYPTED